MSTDAVHNYSLQTRAEKCCDLVCFGRPLQGERKIFALIARVLSTIILFSLFFAFASYYSVISRFKAAQHNSTNPSDYADGLKTALQWGLFGAFLALLAFAISNTKKYFSYKKREAATLLNKKV